MDKQAGEIGYYDVYHGINRQSMVSKATHTDTHNHLYNLSTTTVTIC